jgi:hypothetical protein
MKIQTKVERALSTIDLNGLEDCKVSELEELLTNNVNAFKLGYEVGERVARHHSLDAQNHIIETLRKHQLLLSEFVIENNRLKKELKKLEVLHADL